MIRDSVADIPGLPPGYEIEMPLRETMFFRELAGPEMAPVVFLIHGWTATADLNWSTCYSELARHFRVVAMDMRGHGRGVRSSSSFKLEDCADDIALLANALGISTFIPVGYSMGGAIAQLLWQRHESLVRGVVLCATACQFSESAKERLGFFGLTGLAALSRLTSPQARQWLTEQIYLQKKTIGLEGWALQQFASHDWQQVIEAGSAIGKFDSRQWLPDLVAPASVVVTTQDKIVDLERQRELYQLIADVEVFEVDGEHNSVVTNQKTFVPTLVEACLSAFDRSIV